MREREYRQLARRAKARVCGDAGIKEQKADQLRFLQNKERLTSLAANREIKEYKQKREITLKKYQENERSGAGGLVGFLKGVPHVCFQVAS